MSSRVEQQERNRIGETMKGIGQVLVNGLDQARYAIAPRFPYPWNGYVGLHFENPGFNAPVYLATAIPLELFYFIKRAEFRGARLPNDSGGLVVGNHVKPIDMWILQDLAAREGRTISSFARNTLRDPNAPEADHIKERRRKSRGSDHTGGLYMGLFNWYIGGVGCYWINLGMNDAQSQADTRRAIKDLKKGKLVGAFPQGTRLPELDLLDVDNGMAQIAQLAPNVPIYPVGFNYIKGKPITVVGEPATFNKILQVIRGDKNRRDEIKDRKDEVEVVHKFIIDSIAGCVYDPRQKIAWTLNRKLGLTKEQIKNYVPYFSVLAEHESIDHLKFQIECLNTMIVSSTITQS